MIDWLPDDPEARADPLPRAGQHAARALRASTSTTGSLATSSCRRSTACSTGSPIPRATCASGEGIRERNAGWSSPREHADGEFEELADFDRLAERRLHVRGVRPRAERALRRTRRPRTTASASSRTTSNERALGARRVRGPACSTSAPLVRSPRTGQLLGVEVARERPADPLRRRRGRARAGRDRPRVPGHHEPDREPRPRRAHGDRRGERRHASRPSTTCTTARRSRWTSCSRRIPQLDGKSLAPTQAGAVHRARRARDPGLPHAAARAATAEAARRS